MPTRTTLMLTLLTLSILLAESLAVLQRRDRDDRGDVPGWVMVTVMTAALVAALLAIARPELEKMLSNALKSVG